MTTMKKYTFTKEEMQAIIDYLSFAIEKDIPVDKDEFIEKINVEDF